MHRLYIFIAILAALLKGFDASSQVPQKIRYQAVLRDANNSLLISKNIGIKINLLKGSTDGSVVYSETQTTTTNAFGAINIEFGSGTVVTGTFSEIQWKNGPLYAKIFVDPSGGTNYSITSSSQLLSVPYAFVAQATGNSNVSSTFTHYIGELYGGGIVVAVWKKDGIEEGLIASLTDLESSIWCSQCNAHEIDAKSPIDGYKNTLALLTATSDSTSIIPAIVCHKYNAGGYKDWYLPAIWEIDQLMNNSLIVNAVLGDENGFHGGYRDNGWALTTNMTYWSSTLRNDSNIWITPDITANEDSLPLRIRAFRKFSCAECH